MDDFWASAIWSILPTLGVGLLFWFIMRAVIQSDKQERKAYATIEAAERARMGMPAKDAAVSAPSASAPAGSAASADR